MQKYLIFCLLVAVVHAGTPRDFLKRILKGPRIVGGSPAPISQFPHQLIMEYESRLRCGATIISKGIALSAAHCVEKLSPGDITLRSGSSFFGSGGVVHKVTKYLMHPSYNPDTFDHDLALLFVSPGFDYDGNTQPIDITSSEPTAGQSVTVSGWGTTTEGGSVASQLRAVTVPVISRIECDRDYQDFGGISSRMICAGIQGQDSCQGDSGGPLVLGDTLVGVVSWGNGCARSRYPGVYSNLANPTLRSWVRTNAGV